MAGQVSRRRFINGIARAVTALAVSDLFVIAGADALPGEGIAMAVNGPGKEGMAHASVKLWPGRSEQTLRRLADAITQDLVDILGCRDAFVSVDIREIPSAEWKKEVYDPEIRGKQLSKRPGYSM